MRPPPAALSNSSAAVSPSNINTIPLDAVERVEILLDGASAVYGSDAIAGVVNFILKKNTTEGNVYAQYTGRRNGGGKAGLPASARASAISHKDGWNVTGNVQLSTIRTS